MAISGQSDTTAIFSPSVARVAASTAKDWAYVDAWLASRFPHGREIPKIERSPATLAALLAAAKANEAADIISHQLAALNKAGLRRLNHQDHQSNDSNKAPKLRDFFLFKISSNLSREGRVALEALAETAVSAGIGFPIPENLGDEYLAQQASLLEAERTIARLSSLKNCLTRELFDCSESLREGPSCAVPPSMPKENVELQRKTRARAKLLCDARERLTTLPAPPQWPQINFRVVMQDEERLLALLAEKRGLDKHLALFGGLPSDPHQAMHRLKASQQQLHRLTEQRDQICEGLVEQQSPDKRHGGL